NSDALRQAAHSLRSSSTNLGASGFAHLCKQLEDLGKVGTVTNVTIEPLRSEYPRVKAALQRAFPQARGYEA
ncbi:MAG: Hpt domain-containing protein, partial [Cyanobacteria bacterium P01_A01_bin.17]